MTPAATSSSTRSSALAEAFARLGAETGEGPGSPLGFGDLAAEYRALRAACAVAEGPRGDRLDLTGEDRLRFFNGLVTCEVLSLAPGEGRYGFVTDAKGRVLSDVVVLAAADRLRLHLPAGSAGEVAAHLGRYIVADRVEVTPAPEEASLRVFGPLGRSCLESAGAAEVPAAAWSHGELQREPGFEVTALGGWGEPAWELRGSAEALTSWLERLLAAGARPVGERALETLRIEEGRLRFGVDYGPENFPQESGVEEAVSYDKGCYLGQEIVARIHYRGQVNRLPRGLRLPVGGETLVGGVLRLEEREVGRLTSAVVSPRLEAAIGLALVHRQAAEPGTRLGIEGDGEAKVVELPFATAEVQGTAGFEEEA